MSEEQQNSEAGADADMGSTGHEQEQQSEPEAVESADMGEETETEGTELDKWKTLARKHEENSRGADEARKERDELREKVKELDGLREQVTSRDSQLTTAQHTLAAEKLHTRLARAGVPSDDAQAMIEHIDPSRLIEDGTPSETAIESVAASLSRSVARGVDEDQGQASAGPAIAADQWLRKKARK